MTIELTEEILPEQLLIPKRPRIINFGDFQATRLIGIGDVHGCAEELHELLTKLKLKDSDILVFCGDYVDRGPDSAGVVNIVSSYCRLRPQTYAVLGNHDEKAVRFRRHQLKAARDPGYVNPMKPKYVRSEDWAAISDENCRWMANLPHVAFFRGHYSNRGIRIFTHAGLIQGLDVHQPTDGLIRNRYLIQKKEKWVPAPCVRGPQGEMLQSPGSVIWDEIWEGASVIYGHIVHDIQEPRIHQCALGNQEKTYGIDTGCCFGGRITAYVENLATGEIDFKQIKAYREYEPRDSAGVE